MESALLVVEIIRIVPLTKHVSQINVKVRSRFINIYIYVCMRHTFN